jgi:hypothetical protein
VIGSWGRDSISDTYSKLKERCTTEEGGAISLRGKDRLKGNVRLRRSLIGRGPL